MNELLALSPIDGRYFEKTKELIRKDPEKFYSLANNVPEVLSDKEIVLKIIIYDTRRYIYE